MESIPKKSGIYQIRNLVNGKVYVGSAVNLRARRNRHFSYLRNNCHANRKLQNAFNKYGEENIVFEVVEIVADKYNLLEREQYYIDTLNAVKEGYNIRLIAESNLGIKYSEQSKERIRKAKSNISEETRKRMSISRNKRPPISEETRRRMSLAQSNRSEETRRRMSLAQQGKHMSEETKQRISRTLTEKLKYNEKKVICVETNQEYRNISVASRETHIDRVSIIRCVKGVRKTAGGYHWEYVN